MIWQCQHKWMIWQISAVILQDCIECQTSTFFRSSVSDDKTSLLGPKLYHLFSWSWNNHRLDCWELYSYFVTCWLLLYSRGGFSPTFLGFNEKYFRAFLRLAVCKTWLCYCLFCKSAYDFERLFDFDCVMMLSFPTFLALPNLLPRSLKVRFQVAGIAMAPNSSLPRSSNISHSLQAIEYLRIIIYGVGVLTDTTHKRNKTLFKRNVQTCLKEITIHAIRCGFVVVSRKRK